LKIAYLFQGNGRFSDWKAQHIHIFYTLSSLQDRGQNASLLNLSGRKVLFTDDLDALAKEEFRSEYFGQLGISGSRLFKRFESAIRRAQRQIRIPYLALFDSYRMRDACMGNLQDFDIYHERLNLLAIGGALASRKMGIPYILEVNADMMEQRDYQGTPERGLRRWYGNWGTAFCLKSATRIIAVSEEQMSHLIRKWKVDPTKINVLPCAADTVRFGKAFDSGTVRRRLRLGNNPIVMWIGGFYAWHNLEMLLQSFGIVRSAFPTAKLVLVGDGRTRPQIVQSISENGLRGAVILTGHVKHEDVPELLSAADVAVSPSASEFAGQGGSPLKLFEYMAAGKAIVAGGMSQNSRVIDNGQTGILVEPNDVRSFAEAIVSLLNDPEERKRLGNNSRKQAIEKHSWERYARELERIYASVTAIETG